MATIFFMKETEMQKETENNRDGLPSKQNLDNMNGMKRPESVNPGPKTQTGDSGEKLQLKGDYNIPILTESQNFRKEIGDSMSNKGFVKLPRILLNDPNWKGMRSKYRHVFLIILFHAAYTKKSYGIGSNIINIEPGQLCTSIRNLMDLCNDGIKYKEDKVDKNIIERAVSLFTKIGLVRHEVRHGKSIITITNIETYEECENQCETGFETKPRLNRDTNEERKEREDILETNEGAKALDSSLFENQKKEEDEKSSVFKPETKKIPKDFSEEKQRHFQLLWKFIFENGMAVGMSEKKGIKEQDLILWLKKYDGKRIYECLKFAQKATVKTTYGGYVTKLLQDGICEREGALKEGRQFVEDFVKKHDMKHIDMKKDYFKDLISNEQSYYNLPSNTLEAILKRSKQRAIENEERERRQDDYENEYDDEY